MAQDTWGLIEEKIKANDLLYKRMDRRRKLLLMEDFKLRSYQNTFDLPNVIDVTGNRAATYAHRVIENLSSYKWQRVVKGSITKNEAHKIEEFLETCFEETNIYLNETFEDVPDLYTFWCNHICHTGRIGVEYMSWVEKGEYKIHCVPLDMRWTPYVRGRWVAPITRRGRDELEEELEGFAKRGEKGVGEYTKINLAGLGKGSSAKYEVRDFWNSELNELLVEGKLVYKQSHNYGKPPFVIVVAPAGFMLRDEGYIEHEGEDILFFIEKLIAEQNRLLSIEQTVGMDIVASAYVQPRKNLTALNAQADTIPLSGEATSVHEGEEFQLLPKREITRAFEVARADIDRQIDEGAPMQPRAYNTPPSAIEVATEVEILNQLYNSRTTALKMGLSQLSRLMIEMFILASKTGKGKIELGRYGGQKQFAVEQLKDPLKYAINFQLMTKDTRLEIVNEARALAALALPQAPVERILTDIWKVDDPSGWMRAMDLEKAKAMNPAISLGEMALAYAEEAQEMVDGVERDLKNEQSKLLTHDYVMVMRQRLQPPAMVGQEGKPTMSEEPKGNANALVTLLGQAGKGRAQPKIIARG